MADQGKGVHMKKAVFVAFGIALLALFGIGTSLYSTLQAPASVSVVNPMGGYVIESVRVTGLLAPLGGVAYLRIIDRQTPSTVYRTPLFATQHIDFSKTSEDSRYLDAIVWVRFDKQAQHFSIGMPQWRADWRNRFISNTPFEAGGNG